MNRTKTKMPSTKGSTLFLLRRRRRFFTTKKHLWLTTPNIPNRRRDLSFSEWAHGQICWWFAIATVSRKPLSALSRREKRPRTKQDSITNGIEVNPNGRNEGRIRFYKSKEKPLRKEAPSAGNYQSWQQRDRLFQRNVHFIRHSVSDADQSLSVGSRQEPPSAQYFVAVIFWTGQQLVSGI